MNRKIILSVVLAVCLVFAMFPVEAQAKQTSLLGMILDILFPQPTIEHEAPLEYEAEHIKILNPVSNPTLWGRWIVRFETKGGGDLEIEAFRGTFFEKDIEFIALTCDDEKVEVEKYFSEKGKNEPWVEGIDNGKIVARNWNCDNKTGRLFLRILATGRHYLKFSFLGETVYAENEADCTGTDVSPCHMCDVNDMDFMLRDPGDSNDPRGWQDMTFDSDDGDPCNCNCYTVDCCPDANVTNVTWDDVDGYTFCVGEGTYDVMVRANASGEPYEWESSAWVTAYTITYDAEQNWCDCNYSAGNYYSSGLGEDRCCGDDSGEDWNTSVSEGWCCFDGSRMNNNTNISSMLCYDGQLYSCNDAGNNTADIDQVSCDRVWGWYCDGAGTGADTWKAQKAANLPSDDCDGDQEDPYGEGHSNLSANIESCVNNKVYYDSGNSIGNQNIGTWTCNNWRGPYIAMCNLTQLGGGDFNEIYLYMEAADEVDSGAQFGYIYRVGDYDTVSDQTAYNDSDYPGTMNYNTTSVQDSGNIDANEGTYGDYMNLTKTFADMENQITDEGTYYFEIGSEESQGSAQIEDWEDPNSNEGSCVISGTLCVAVGYSATADSDCCPVGGTTSEYPGKDDDDGKCVRCWTNNNTQKEGSTGNGLCEQKCGASPECDEKAIGFSNETVSCSSTCQVNYKPTHSTPLLNSTSGYNVTSDNITCWNQSTSDPDNDPVTNVYNWYKDDTPIMVLNMPFDTNVSTTASDAVKDYSGYDNNGTLKNFDFDADSGWTNSGKVGGAYMFDGGNDLINISDSASLEPSTITVELWAKWDTIGDDWLIEKHNVSDPADYNNGYLIRCDTPTDTVRWYVGDGSTYASTSASITTGTWYHVVGTFNGTHTVLYVNGSFQGSSTAISSIDYTDVGNLFIGASNANTLNFNGTIDQVRIYDRSLSAEQINSLYQESKDGYSYKSTIVSQETGNNDQWICGVTPNDGTDDGTAKNSSTLTVGDDAIDGGSETTCDASNPCLYLKNSTDVVARFDQFGYVDVKGGYSDSQSSLSPPDDSFVVENSTNDVVLYIDKLGNIAMLGIFSRQVSPAPSGGNDFVVQNSTDTAGYIDGGTGNMYFKGLLHYNSDF